MPQVNDTAIGLVRSNEDADHAAMRDIVLVRASYAPLLAPSVLKFILFMRQDRMNALWSKDAKHAPAGHATAGEAAPDTDHTASSITAAPAAESLKLSASQDDGQALQLLQANRKLEAKLQVWRHCSSLPLIHSCFDFCHQELKRRVAALEEEKARAFAEAGTEKDKRCAQQ
jgi:hypothetical protein